MNGYCVKTFGTIELLSDFVGYWTIAGLTITLDLHNWSIGL